MKRLREMNAPYIEPPIKKEDLEAELKPVVGILEGLVPIVAELVQWREKFRVWQDSKFASIDATLEAENKRVGEQAEQFKVVGKLIESLGNVVIQSHGAKWCVDDIKGFKRLGIEPLPYTLEHMKKE